MIVRFVKNSLQIHQSTHATVILFMATMNRRSTALLLVGCLILSRWSLTDAQETTQYTGNLEDERERTINDTTVDHEQIEIVKAPTDTNVERGTTAEHNADDKTEKEKQSEEKKDPKTDTSEKSAGDSSENEKQKESKEKKRTVITHIPELPPR